MSRLCWGMRNTHAGGVNNADDVLVRIESSAIWLAKAATSVARNASPCKIVLKINLFT